MKILIVTDTWHNINGVVTTLRATKQELENRSHQVHVIEPSQFKTVACPGYPEVRLSWNLWHMGKLIEQVDPDCIHIATEGPLGIAARTYCKLKRITIPYNTSYHTKFPEYLHVHHKLPLSWGYFWMKLFHKYSHRVLVTHSSMQRELQEKGFNNLVIWNRGVDPDLFHPDYEPCWDWSKPILLCVSRVSPEKGLDDFCRLQTVGTKVLVGDGPHLPQLREKYPDVKFVGYKTGASLAQCYASSDVFVFPSKTDTFGVVMLEALACGIPVAAYPVTGPLDVIEPGVNGFMHEDLQQAVNSCVHMDTQKVAQTSLKFSWAACTDVFEQNLIQIPNSAP
jgi:glycosyltransferase involved in cell wall biosynthesis